MDDSAYVIRGASSDDDLRGIVALQAANLPDAIDADERREQGFVTLRHDVALLREMMAPWPHVIATAGEGGEVVAYALTLIPRFRARFPVLAPTYEQLDEMARPGGCLEGRRFYFMGQVCVAKPHRGRGLIERLYAGHRAMMTGAFDLMVTVIDTTNTRSIRAHERAGCAALREFRGEDGREWLIVAMPISAGLTSSSCAPSRTLSSRPPRG